MTGANHVIWTETRAHGNGLVLVVDLRLLAGVAVAIALIAVPTLAAPLGRLASPFALLVALPPLAIVLEAFGWRERLAGRIARVRPVLLRLLASYAAWAFTSSVLTLDVAAVAAASVGIAVAGHDHEERRWQLGGAILGANVGSLLLPFSNLTNLVLVAGSGLSFAAYVRLAIWPQIAAAMAVGLLFAMRARRSLGPRAGEPGTTIVESETDAVTVKPDPLAGVAGAVTLAGAAGAIACGLTGRDMAVPFAMAAGTLAGIAVATGRLGIGRLARAIPPAGLAVIGFATIASGPIATAAGMLPRPDGTLAGLTLALVAGGLLSVLANNLPAAFGAIWLLGAHPATIVAYLIGTNVVAVATPHGSVATILARAVAERHGVATPVGAYLRVGWQYAAIGSLAGMAALTVVAR